MKKMIAFLTVAALLVSFGCSRGDVQPTVCTTDPTSSASTAVTDIPTETTAAPTTTSTTTSTTASTAAPTTEPTSVDSTTDNTSAAPQPSQTQTSAVETTTRQNLLDRLRDNVDGLHIDRPYKKSADFFNDAVFIGDSVTQGLKNYTTARRNKGETCLGTAQFLCCGSMSYTNALSPVTQSSLHPTYKGKKVSVEEGIRLCGAKKVFLMLGMNDFSAYGEKTQHQSVNTLLDRIQKTNPHVKIYIQSVTPIVNGKEHGSFTNENIDKFNNFLRSVCAERGLEYVDINGCVMRDESGHLKKEYCGDSGAMGIHMSNTGSSAWVQYLHAEFCGIG